MGQDNRIVFVAQKNPKLNSTSDLVSPDISQQSTNETCTIRSWKLHIHFRKCKINLQVMKPLLTSWCTVFQSLWFTFLFTHSWNHTVQITLNPDFLFLRMDFSKWNHWSKGMITEDFQKSCTSIGKTNKQAFSIIPDFKNGNKTKSELQDLNEMCKYFLKGWYCSVVG